MALIESQNRIKPHNLMFFKSDEYEVAVDQSVQSLLESLQNPSADLSALTSRFLELMQAKPNPLLESIWAFSGLTFHMNNSTKDDILEQVSVVKTLFQSMTGRSASCSSSTSITLIAPVIFKLHRLLVESKRKEVDSKRGKKARREISKFLDVILGYLNLCCDGSNSDEDSALVTPLIDLVSIWVPDEPTGNRLKQFFPLLSDEILSWVADESGGVLGLLAGAVIVEAFMLKLCLQFSEGGSRKEVLNDLRTWAVCSITGFHNFYFFDMLMKMLLEPNLSHLTVTSLLSSEDESFLRKVLYDAVILPDYSFLHLDKLGHLPIIHIKNNILARIMVTHEAVELFRKNNDHSKAILYTNAFSGSHLLTLITKLVTNEPGNHDRTSQPQGSSPMAFLQWMTELEGEGLSFSDGFMSKHREKLFRYCSRSNLGQPSAKMDQDFVFFIDSKGNAENKDENEDDDEDEDEDEYEYEDGDEFEDEYEDEDVDEDANEDENEVNYEVEKMDDSMTNMFVGAANAMLSDANKRGKKRKQIRVEKKKNRVKVQRRDESKSESEVENPDSDDVE